MAKSSETRPNRDLKPRFQKNRFWEHVDRDPSDKIHGLFCPHKFEEGLLRALNLRHRSSSASSEQAAGLSKRVRISDASEASPR